MFLTLLTLILAIGEIHSTKLPKSWKVCKKEAPDMNECLQKAIEFAIHDMTNGKPSLGILPLDPLKIDSITINQGSGPVKIILKFTNLTITGFKDIKINSVRNDWKTLEFKSTINQLILDSFYSIKGNVLILPIEGSGHSRLVFDNYRTTFHIKLKEIEINGSKHYEITDISFEFDEDKVNIHFDNLFNGDKKLGDNMNLYINQNSKEILQDLKPAISSTFGEAFTQLGNRIFSKITVEELTPD